MERFSSRSHRPISRFLCGFMGIENQSCAICGEDTGHPDEYICWKCELVDEISAKRRRDKNNAIQREARDFILKRAEEEAEFRLLHAGA